MADSDKMTPMMKQYLCAKAETPPGSILMFRLGDFYEMFFEDASRAAPILDVVLTRRAGTPMCGVPYHAIDAYLPKLLDAGIKVAIAEQMEDPKMKDLSLTTERRLTAQGRKPVLDRHQTYSIMFSILGRRNVTIRLGMSMEL